MENKQATYEKLRQAWRNLNADVRKNKKVKFEHFNAVFEETYKMLSEFSVQESLDKGCVEVVAEAFLFANIKDDTLDENCMAAFVLTERMLSYCAFNSSSSAENALTIYIAEARREVRLDFSDVSESVSTLARIFKEFFLQKVSG